MSDKKTTIGDLADMEREDGVNPNKKEEGSGEETSQVELDAIAEAERIAKANEGKSDAEIQEEADRAAEAALNKDKSGVDLFLMSKGYNPNEIPLTQEDKTVINKPFSELEPNIQLNIFDSLTKKQGVDLTEAESADLAVLREGKVSLQDYVNNISETKINEYRENETDSDINSLSNKDLYTKFIKDGNSEITDEDLDSKYETLEESGKLESKITGIKEHYADELKVEKDKVKAELSIKLDEFIEDDRGSIANIATTIESIGGWKITPAAMNKTLDRLMETVEDKEGNKMSKFQSEVMNDPEQMIKAEWYLRNGDAHFKMMENEAVRENLAAFERGRQSILQGESAEGKEKFHQEKKDENQLGNKDGKKYKTAADLID